LFITILQTTPEALWLLVEYLRPTPSQRPSCYLGNGAGVMAALRTALMNLLRLTGFDTIREGLQATMHDIAALLAIATRKPELNRS
jgi:hypothetical protein